MKNIHKTILLCTIFVPFSANSQEDKTKISQEDRDNTAKQSDSILKIVKSPNGESYFPTGKESYYTPYYKAAELPSLLKKREPKGYLRFRLAIIPSFSKPIFFTYSRSPKGAQIEVKRLNIKTVNNSIEPDKIELSGKIKIGSWNAKRLERDVVTPEIRQPYRKLTEQQRDAYNGLDGSIWILEVSTDKDYTMEDIWSPETVGTIDVKFLKENRIPKVDLKHFIDFGYKILKLTDMKRSENGIPEE